MIRRYSEHRSIVKQERLQMANGQVTTVTYTMVSNAYSKNPRLTIEIPEYKGMAMDDIKLSIVGSTNVTGW